MQIADRNLIEQSRGIRFHEGQEYRNRIVHELDAPLRECVQGRIHVECEEDDKCQGRNRAFGGARVS